MSGSSAIFNSNPINTELDGLSISLFYEDNISLINSNTADTNDTSFNSFGGQLEYLSLTEEEIIQSPLQQNIDNNLIATVADEATEETSTNQEEVYDLFTGSNNTTISINASSLNSLPSYIQNSESTFAEEAIITRGDNSQTVTATLSVLSGDSDYRNEVGLFLVDDETGKIGDLSPGDAGYAEVALSSERRILDLAHGQQTATIEIEGGSYLGSYLIQNSTSEEFLAINSDNTIDEEINIVNPTNPVAFFNFTAANPDNFAHLQTDSNDDGNIVFAWEDLTGGGDEDFNDLEVKLSLTDNSSVIEGIKWEDINEDGIRNGVVEESTVEPSLNTLDNNTLLLSGEETQQITATLSALEEDTIYSNEMGLFLVDDETGKIGELSPDDAGYAEAALATERRIVTLFQNRQITSTEINNSSYFGSYLIQNSTSEEFLAVNPDNILEEDINPVNPSKPVAFFNFAAANPDSFNHLQTNSNDDGSITFAWEDLTGGGDEDFNDLVVRVGITDVQTATNSEPIEPGITGVQIYLDTNNNGVLDDDEPVVTTSEDNPDTDTDETGTYRFTDLDAGTYTVREVIPDGYEQTAPSEGQYTVDLEPRTIVSSIDFGNILRSVTLTEEDNFRVTARRSINIPAEPSVLSFSYSNLNFDNSDTDFINDGFEVALVDENGNSLVSTISSDRDAFFNLTEGEEASLANGVSIENQTVILNLAGIAPGTQANLIFRLVNNDNDTTTTVTVEDIRVETAEVTPPEGVTPEIESFAALEEIDINGLEDVSASFIPQYQRTSFNEETNVLYADIAVSNQGQYLVDAPLVVVIKNISDPSVRILDAYGFTSEGLPYFEYTGLVEDGTLDPDETTNSRTISFLNPNRVQFDYDLTFLGNLNQAPQFTTEPDEEAIVDKSYTYNADAIDADDDTLTYSLSIAPQGMTINSETGEINWSPTAEDEGNYNVVVAVEDGRGGIAEQNYTLSAVTPPPNRPPIITSVPIISSDVDTEYTYQVVATDADGDTLTYSLTQAPDGLTIDEDTGEINWNPNSEQTGINDVVVEVTDEQGATATQSYQIVVASDNNAPVIVSEPVIQANIGGEISEPQLIDFSTWSTVQYSGSQTDASWEIQPDTGNNVVLQTRNANASIFIGDFELAGNQVEGTWKVDSVLDDDFMGFVFGYQDSQNYYLFDWKLNDQNSSFGSGVVVAERGMSVKVVTTDTPPTGSDLWATEGNGDRVKSLFHNNIGWEEFTEYDFSLEFTPGLFTIAVTEKETGTILESVTIEDDTFTDGKFGFYNYSQDNVEYSGFALQSLPGDYLYDVEAIDLDNDDLTYELLEAPEGAAIEADTGLLRWYATSEDEGTYPITVEVKDGRGGIDIQSFDLEVINIAPGKIRGTKTEIFDPTIIDPVKVEVSGDSNPWLAGLPDGTTASLNRDSAPERSPVLVEDLALDGAEFVTFDIRGSVDINGGRLVFDADGSKLFGGTPTNTGHIGGSENGIGNLFAPINSAIGVFLGEDSPDLVDAPAESLNFGNDGNVLGGINYLSLDPELQQPFFIGDGFTDDGERQKIIVPEGAARLYLGTMSTGAYFAATGEFDASVAIEENKHNIFIQPWRIYIDSNNNGLRDKDELFATVDDDGEYVLPNLIPGTYIVREELRPEWQQISPETGFYEVEVEGDEIVGNIDFTNQQLLDPDNIAPVITSTPTTEIEPEEEYTYQVAADDQNGDRLTFDLPSKPQGMVIDPDTGKIVWNPNINQIGTNSIVVRVQDGSGGIDLQSFNLEVLPPNNDPVITSTPPTIAGVEVPIAYQVVAQDDVVDTLTYSLENAPKSADIDPNTGLLIWTPTAEQIGNSEFTITVTDNRGGSTSQTFAIETVSDFPNNVPVISSTPRKAIRVEENYQYQIVANDPDNEPLSYSLDEAPDGMTLSDRGLIEWFASPEQFGDNSVTLTVRDTRGGTTQQSFNITVVSQAQNSNPIFESEPPQTIISGETLIYNPVVTDPEGDRLTFYSPPVVNLFSQLNFGGVTTKNVSEQTPGFSINPDTGEIRWTPTFEDVGMVEIGIVAGDPYGGAASRIFEVEVVAGNRPPLITSVPITQSAVGDNYAYAIAANDPDDNTVTLVLEQAPAGMTLDGNTLVWQPEESQLGESQVIISATDSLGAVTTQEYTVVVESTLPNRPPVITSTPTQVATPDALYQYQVTATDPEGDTLTYTVENAPEGLTIEEDTGLIQWTPTDSQIGATELTIKAIDSQGASSTQVFSLVVAVNEAPVINSPPVTAVSVGETYQYDLQAVDPNGDRLTYTLLQAPEGMTVDEFGRIVWETDDSDLGNYDVEVAVSDPGGETVTQAYQLEAIADTEAPVVNLLQDNTLVDVGSSVILQVNASDNVGVEELTLTVDGVPVALDDRGQAEITIDSLEEIEAIATATDAAGNTGTETVTVQGIDSSDVNAPILDITSISDGDIISEPTDIIGTVNDDNLVSYSLAVAPVSGGEFVEIASGTDTVIEDEIALFDTSLLQNDTYRLRLSATDGGGNTSTIERQVSVEGELKLGNFQLSFVDLAIPLTGIPITIARTYDTLNSNEQDDFGFGWNLGLVNTNLRTSVAPSGLEASDIYNPFEIGTRVYVTNPSTGIREGYTFTVESPSRYAIFGNVRPKFIPDAGVTSTLSVRDIDLSLTADNELVSFVGSLPYNPASGLFGGSYTLTTKEGISYNINGNTGDVQRISDRNSNTLTFTDAGITSSTGESITFERDAQNRITAVIDPTGERIEYSYDANGDLVSVTDREDNTTRFEYSEEQEHYLDEVIDPLGREAVKNEYDENGRLTKIFDASGAPLDFTYDPENFVTTTSEILNDEGDVATTIIERDADGNILRQVNPDGGEIVRTYDADNNLLTETDALGNTTTFTYDSRRNLLSETDALGNTTQLTYNSTNDLTSITDPLGNTTTYIYSNGNPITSTDALGRVSTFDYTSSGLLTNFDDVFGFNRIQRSFTYNASGYQLTETDGLGNTTTFTRDDNGRILTSSIDVTTPEGTETLTTTFTYDAEGRTISTTDAEGNTERTEYDALGQIVAEIDGLGNRTEFTYNDRGEQTAINYPDGTTETFVYDLGGRQIAQTDRAGRTTFFEYDVMDRLVATILPDATPEDLSDNPRIRQEYDLEGQLTANIDPLGNRTEFVYDATGRQIETIDALGNNTTTEYDAAGRQIETTDALGRETEFTYDAVNRLVETTFADGTSTAVNYPELGVEVRTDANGNATRFEYDVEGRLIAVQDALNNRTEYSYDELGRLIAQEDANDNVTNYEYDGLGRRIGVTLAEGQESSTNYNAIGNVASETDFNGDTITYEYDSLNRLTKETLPNGDTVTYSYTATGQLETVIDNRGTTTFAYDEQDRLLSRTEPDGRAIFYTYDLAGNRTSISSPGGTTDYSFDALNRISSISDSDGGTTTYTYDAVSNLILTELPNNVEETRTYDLLNRLQLLETTDVSDSILSSYQYTRDNVGNILRVTETDRTVNYAYDALYRLTEEEIIDNTNGNRDIAYTYDNVGNRLTRADSVEGTTTYNYNDNNQLLTEQLNGETTTYTYDANGQIITQASTDGTESNYTWDSKGRLIEAKVNDGTTTTNSEYEYDFEGIRVGQTVDGEETKYLIDNSQPFAQVREESASDDTVKALYAHSLGASPILIVRNGNVSYYHGDQVDSTRLLTDESGNVTDRYIYDAFGRILTRIGDTENNYLYTGEQFDESTSLNYLRARYLDSNTGRFISRDPFDGFLTDPLSLNKYLYSSVNPVNGTDPSGLFTLPQVLVATAVVGTISGIVAAGQVSPLEQGKAFKEGFIKGAVGTLVLASGAALVRSLYVFATTATATTATTAATATTATTATAGVSSTQLALSRTLLFLLPKDVVTFMTASAAKLGVPVAVYLANNYGLALRLIQNFVFKK